MGDICLIWGLICLIAHCTDDQDWIIWKNEEISNWMITKSINISNYWTKREIKNRGTPVKNNKPESSMLVLKEHLAVGLSVFRFFSQALQQNHNKLNVTPHVNLQGRVSYSQSRSENGAPCAFSPFTHSTHTGLNHKQECEWKAKVVFPARRFWEMFRGLHRHRWLSLERCSDISCPAVEWVLQVHFPSAGISPMSKT